MPYPVAPPMAPIAKPTPAPGGGGCGGGGGAPVPPGPDLQYQRMIREELIDLWDAIKKTHNAGNADVLAQFGALREEVIKKARGEVQHSVGNARKAVEALQYAQQGAQAATEQWQAGQEEARRSFVETSRPTTSRRCNGQPAGRVGERHRHAGDTQRPGATGTSRAQGPDRPYYLGEHI